MYSTKINPKLYCRPKNVRVGNEYMYIPDNVIATDAIPKGEIVKITKKVAIEERGRAIVQVEYGKNYVNVLLEHLAIIF